MATVVDFIPKISTTGDFKKITDNNLLTSNNKVSTLLNYLEMVAGRNSIFTDFGAYQELMSIPFTEDAEIAANRISHAISSQLAFQVSVSFETNDDKDHIELTVTVEGLPQNLKLDMERNRKWVRFVNPRLV